MGIKILIYAWIGLTITLVAIPVSVIVYWLGKKLVNYLYTIVKSLKKDVELHTIKTELQQQKEDFITSSTGNPNDEAGIEPTETSKSPDGEELPIPTFKELEDQGILQEKEKKRLDAILLEAEWLKNDGKLEQYEKKLIEALAIDSTTLKVLKPLADLYFALGNYKKALPFLKKITELEPTDHRVIWQISEVYFVAGDTQTAELLIEKAINLKNDNPRYYLTLVEICYNTGRATEALAYMEKIIKLRPKNPKYLLATAELYEQIGDKDNAKKYYFNVLEYEQNNEKAKAKIREFTEDF